ncbi:MAG: hypothetical protein ACPGVP_05755 [Thiolinea sp.]
MSRQRPKKPNRQFAGRYGSYITLKRLYLLRYRVSRIILYALSSMACGVVAIGSWQNISQPSHYNPKSHTWHETNGFDIFFDVLFSILFGAGAILTFLSVLGFILFRSVTCAAYEGYRMRHRKKRRDKRSSG